MALFLFVGLVIGSSGCGSSGKGGTAGSGGTAGAGAATGSGGAGNGGAAGADAATSDGGGQGGTFTGTGYSLLIAQSPPGPSIAMNLWSGVLRFAFSAPGAAPLAVSGIDKSLVADPLALAYRASSSEIFVGNRHGNTAADGVPGSISRFVYDPSTGALTPNGTITGNGLNQIAQIAFHPATGEMFVCNTNIDASTGTIVPAAVLSRFTFDATGQASANGTLGNGGCGGVAVSPDGNSVWVSRGGAGCPPAGGTGCNTIQVYDLATGAGTDAITIATATRIFELGVVDGELYAPAVDGSAVYRLTIGAAGALTMKDSFTASGAIALAQSPAGDELFVSGHLTTDLVTRFSFVAATGSWQPVDTLSGSSSLGGIVAVPGSAGQHVDAGVTVSDGAPQ